MFALRDALVPGTGSNDTSDTALAAKLKMSRQTIYEWKHDPRFVAWLASELKGEHDHDWSLILSKHSELAKRGSVKSAEFIARTRSIGVKGGGFTDQGGDHLTLDASVKNNYSVVILSPRPPAMPAPALPAAPGGQS